MGNRFKRARIALGATALALAACAFLGVRSARRAMAACHPAHKALRAEDRVAAKAAALTLEDAVLRTSDGLTLRGWYVPSRRGPAVILVHGGFDNRAHWIPEIRFFSEHGYGVLAYDSRGSGESDGDLVTAGDREQRDVTAALDFVTKRADVAPSRIGLVGFSFGSSTVALAAARDPRARAVALLATWTSLEDETRRANGKYGPITALPALWGMRHEGIDFANVRPIDHVAEIHPRPLLIVTGDADDDTPVAVMQRVLDAAAPPKAMWVVPGAHHGDYAEVAPAEYEAKMIAFFDAALL